MNIAWKYPSAAVTLSAPVVIHVEGAPSVGAAPNPLPGYPVFQEVDANGNPVPPPATLMASAVVSGDGYDIRVQRMSTKGPAATFLQISFPPYQDGGVIGAAVIEIDWTGVDDSVLVFSAP